MSPFVDLITHTLESEVGEPIALEPWEDEYIAGEAAIWDPVCFAEEQIRSLVRQVFLTGSPKPNRQIVFSAVDANADITAICMQVGQELSAATVSGATCVANGDVYRTRSAGTLGQNDIAPSQRSRKAGCIRDLSRQVSAGLWRVPFDVFVPDNQVDSEVWMRRRLAELRSEFDYTILQAPAAGLFSEAATLGRQCDGVILVLQANSTRKAAALKVKQLLSYANARLLGTVLTERTFPIPEAIYRRL